MSIVDKITKMTEQYNKSLESAEKHKKKAKEQMELAEKHTKKAEDLKNQIKYLKGEEVFDRVNALQLTTKELNLVLKLLDDKKQLLDVVQILFPERVQSGITVKGDDEVLVCEEDDRENTDEYSEDENDKEVLVLGEDDQKSTDEYNGENPDKTEKGDEEAAEFCLSEELQNDDDITDDIAIEKEEITGENTDEAVPVPAEDIDLEKLAKEDIDGKEDEEIEERHVLYINDIEEIPVLGEDDQKNTDEYNGENPDETEKGDEEAAEFCLSEELQLVPAQVEDLEESANEDTDRKEDEEAGETTETAETAEAKEMEELEEPEEMEVPYINDIEDEVPVFGEEEEEYMISVFGEEEPEDSNEDSSEDSYENPDEKGDEESWSA